MAFRQIPATPPEGFRMGSRGNHPDEEPGHRVRIVHPYWIAETLITESQFALWTYAKGLFPSSSLRDKPENPRFYVPWSEAVAYCGWLTGQVRERLPVGVNLACLPSEAEWEYACRAGSQTDYHTGDGEAALAEAAGFDEPPPGCGTNPVKRGAKNEWDLYDCHGHAWQWCHNAWAASSGEYRHHVDGDNDRGSEERWTDYATPDRRKWLLSDPQERLLRGGSSECPVSLCRSAFRGRVRDPIDYWQVGFRVCLAPGPAEPQFCQQEDEAARGAEAAGRGTRPEVGAAGTAGAETRALADTQSPRVP